ncbi:MAG: hypothetical protein AB7E96_10335 [Deferribacterales bacterium]
MQKIILATLMLISFTIAYAETYVQLGRYFPDKKETDNGLIWYNSGYFAEVRILDDLDPSTHKALESYLGKGVRFRIQQNTGKEEGWDMNNYVMERTIKITQISTKIWTDDDVYVLFGVSSYDSNNDYIDTTTLETDNLAWDATQIHMGAGYRFELNETYLNNIDFYGIFSYYSASTEYNDIKKTEERELIVGTSALFGDVSFLSGMLSAELGKKNITQGKNDSYPWYYNVEGGVYIKSPKLNKSEIWQKMIPEVAYAYGYYKYNSGNTEVDLFPSYDTKYNIERKFSLIWGLTKRTLLRTVYTNIKRTFENGESHKYRNVLLILEYQL